MKGGGGGSDVNMSKSWCSNCRTISTVMLSTPSLHPSSSSPGRKGVNSLLKLAMSLAMVVFLFSVYQSCAPVESSLPVWLSLSFVSRPSFILSSAELSQQPQERPASNLVETLGPVPLDRNLSPLPSAVGSFSSDKGTGPSKDQASSQDQTSDKKRDTLGVQDGSFINSQSEKEETFKVNGGSYENSQSEARETFEVEDGSLIDSQGPSDSDDSDSSASEKALSQEPLDGFNSSDFSSSSVEKDVLVDSAEDSLQISNSSDSSSPDVQKDEFKASETEVLAETTLMEGLNSNSSDSFPSSFPPAKEEPKESETMSPSETTSMEIVNSNPNDSVTSTSPSAEKEEVKESLTTVIEETTSTESTKNDGLNEGIMSEDGGLGQEQLGGAVSSNKSQETRPEINASIQTQETTSQTDAVIQFQETTPQTDAATSIENAPHQDDVSEVVSAPSAPATETKTELSQTAQPSSADTEVATLPPIAEIAEKPKDEHWVRLQEQLQAAKQAIQVATLADADQSLYGVIYHNVSAFSKSYRLMEEMFKIYVYKEGKPPLVHTGPLLGIYASEGMFLDRIKRGSSYVVDDPEQAHMFYLPYSVTQMTLTIYVAGSRSMQPLKTFVKDYVDQVAATHPFWNRTGGADHFFVACHDWGPATTRGHEELRNNAMKVVCNADLNNEYVVGKDASLPEIYVHNYEPVEVGGPEAIRRTILAFFAGQIHHGHVRPVLIEHWKDKDPDMKIYEVLPKSVEMKMNYVEHMKNSKYCICAAGFEVNSPRIVESIYYDCVPVIIADDFVLPFSDVLNWSTFSVTIPESEIPNLKAILLSYSDRQYRSMQKRLSKVRQHVLWHDEPVKYDMFNMIMHSVWMSRLNRLDS